MAILKGVMSLGLGAVLGWFGRGKLGAGGPPPGMGAMQMPPPAVRMMTVEEVPLETADEYIAHVEPVQEVSLVPEVSGQIEAVYFEEGAMVQEGEVLLRIDSASYRATADSALAELLRAQRRYERLQRADSRSVARTDLEAAESDYLRAKAAEELAQVDLRKTEIKAPVSGRIGALLVKKGNYVSPATPSLARIVQLDPIRVVFSQTDRDYLEQRRSELAAGAISYEARVLLADGSLYSRPGTKDFDDNVIQSETGTLAVRYRFENADGLLVPGGYVTVRLINSAAPKGIRIPQRALLIDAQGAYVLTVDAAGKVGVLRVSAGDQVGQDVVILSGLKAGDRVMIDGLQKTRPGAVVQVVGE